MPGSSPTEIPSERAALAQALFSPKRIALIGASPDADRLTSRPQRVLRRHGYPGAICPIDPDRDEINGDRTYAAVGQIPGGAEHALIMTPAHSVAQAVAECAAAGVKVATVFTAGFAELGQSGKRRQNAIAAIARQTGLRILGPNCLGVVNVTGRVTISANAVFEHEVLESGGISVVSQSGSMLGGIVTRGQERGLGFSKLVSVGNEADLGVGAVVDLLVDDADTRVVLLFLEALRDAPQLARAARRAFDAGKPVIALKLGRSSIGRALSASHTGAMAGEDDVADAFFRAHGILRVDVFEALFEAAQLVLGQRPPSGRRVAALTVSGGGAALVVDRLGMAGIEIVAPPSALVARLAAEGIRIGDAPLVDLPMGRADGGAYARILQALLASDHCDAVLAVQGSNATYVPDSIRERVLAAQPGAKPLAVFLGPRADTALALLQAHGVAGFRTPEACADALRAYFDWQPPAASIALDSAIEARLEAFAVAADAYPDVLNEDEGHRVLEALGIPCAEARVLHSSAEAADLSFPLAAKILSRDIPHKTDIGGVVLDIATAGQLGACVNDMLSRAHAARPDARIDGVLVQRMQRGLGEVFVGYRRDADVGPAVVLGVGGLLAETCGGHVVRLAPVSIEAALEMIAAVPGLALLRGRRNRPRGDLRALAGAIHKLSLLALLARPRVLEAEINPLIVRADGVVAVDAFVRFDAEQRAPHQQGDLGVAS
jgi:acyl-CoA synthetase (NDP forming)